MLVARSVSIDIDFYVPIEKLLQNIIKKKRKRKKKENDEIIVLSRRIYNVFVNFCDYCSIVNTNRRKLRHFKKKESIFSFLKW